MAELLWTQVQQGCHTPVSAAASALQNPTLFEVGMQDGATNRKLTFYQIAQYLIQVGFLVVGEQHEGA